LNVPRLAANVCTGRKLRQWPRKEHAPRPLTQNSVPFVFVLITIPPDSKPKSIVSLAVISVNA
jgi:hypothetical protein